MSKKNNKQQAPPTQQQHQPFSEQDMPALPQKKPDLGKDKIQIGAHFLNVKVDKRNKKKDAKNTATAPVQAAPTKMLSKGALLKEGRHFCGCEGDLHEVITNCLSCGKIVCEQERLGPCLFCGHDVHAHANLTQRQKEDAEFVKAWEHRNKLLDYDKNFEERTTVIDDQIDFEESTSNVWLTDSEKAEKKKKEEKLKELKDDRRKLVFSFDFAGRRVLVDNSKTEEELSKLTKDLQKSNASTQKYTEQQEQQEQRVALHPGVLQNKIKYVPPKGQQPTKAKSAAGASKWNHQKVQHEFFVVDDENDPDNKTLEFFNETDMDIIEYDNPSTDEHDTGMCMSMHQPWASLLVLGIKRHEGREWNTEHRGRLWIASTREKPTDELVEQIETQYKQMNRKGYPKYYPQGVILGCVDVIDCVPQEKYQKTIPEDEKESQSSFVFICKNPRRLVVPLGILGKPGIYALDKDTVQRAQLGLRSLPQVEE